MSSVPYSYRTYAGDGSTVDFGVPFLYLERAHVQVFVDDVLKADGTDYDWTSDTNVQFKSAPGSTDTVRVQRNTPESDQIVQWQDGSYIISEDLNQSDLQWLYNIQELQDAIGQADVSALKNLYGITPIQVDKTDPQRPRISIDEINSDDNPNTDLTSDTDVVSAKAIDAFYSQIVGDGSGFPESGDIGKDGKLRIDPSGSVPNLFYWKQSISSWIQIPTKGDPGGQGPAGPSPGLQSPPADATNVPLKGDGTVGDATASVSQDDSGDLKFNFGIPVGETGAQGSVGPDGKAATVDAGSATSLAYDAAPTVSNSGSTSAAVFNFGIPKGMPQKVGIAGTPPTTIAGAPVKPGDLWLDDSTLQLYVYYKDPSGDEYWVSVARMGDRGPAATIAVGKTETGAPGTSAKVVNTGTTGAAVFDFTIPRGDKGDKGNPGNDGADSTVPGPQGPGATVAVKSTETLGPGSSAYVNNVGTNTDAYLEFGIPKGDTGATGSQGPQGDTSTITVDDTVTLPPGRDANVVNIGTNTAAEFVFYIPEGKAGENGQPVKVACQDSPPRLIGGVEVESGDLWLNTSNLQLYTYYIDPSKDQYWVSVSKAGEKGDTGEPGKDGKDSTVPGPQGEAATITVGSTTTGAPGTEASVSNGGDKFAAELNFTIPEGIAGKDGKDGEDGKDGDPQKMAVSDVPPTTIDGKAVAPGDTWFNSTTATQYVRYRDPNNDEYWVSTTSVAPAIAQVGASPPANQTTGQLFWNTTDSKLQLYDGSSWVDV